MTLLVIGATGTLGSALVATARARGLAVAGAARSGADHAVDATDAAAVSALLAAVRPSTVVNCVALTDLNACERDPATGWLVNARAAGLIAGTFAAARLVHVSTDHFFTGDGAQAHGEDAPVTLVNDYARAKYAAEALALAHRNTLVVRTNVVGWRGWAGRPTFVEWAAGAISRREPVSGFEDFFTSSIDAPALSAALLDLVPLPVRGVLNVASSEVASKLQFLRALAAVMGVADASITASSVRNLPVRRAESAGLDVSRAEALLGRRLPGLAQVVAALVREGMPACAS
jgi:dTDP-4-dehydrorhamnose reductase